MSLNIIRIATRKSPLALWQAQHIAEQLKAQWPGLSVELVPMVTSGDKFLKDKLLVAGGKGLFVKELEEALLKDRADIAVHSTKDMPAHLPFGLSLPVICKRDNPLDAFVSTHYSSLQALPQQAVVGTASLRRQSQLLAYRPDLQIKTLRGNIHTRLAKLNNGEYDAVILAASGLERMSLESNIKQMLPIELMLPACGQGALSIECRSEDKKMLELIAPLNDALSALCVHIERQVNAQLGGNCHVPLAVYCTPTSTKEFCLRARLLSHDGTKIITYTAKGTHSQAVLLANQCTDSLLAQGALSLIKSSIHQ